MNQPLPGDGYGLIKFKITSGPVQGYLQREPPILPALPLPGSPYFVGPDEGTAFGFLDLQPGSILPIPSEGAQKVRELLRHLGIQFEEIPWAPGGEATK